MSTVALAIIAALTLVSALAAATLRNLMRAALMFAATFLGLSALFFFLGAEFIGLVLAFVYVGAVAVLIVFTILLTRRGPEKHYGFNWAGVLIAIAVFLGLGVSIFKTPRLGVAVAPVSSVSVKQIGEALMTNYVWPLQCVGVLLTAALIGALVLVMEEKR